MGRPLKIAKAQNISTITATATTGVVTFTPAITSTVGFTVGMPIVAATTVGGIVGGTTYWVLTIPSTTTMTLSATPLDANWYSTPIALTSTTGQSVKFSVGVVDSGFNNPEGSANTYSVVGGNTNIYGNQVLTRVAIGRSGTGTITSASGSADVYGAGTDFANTVAAGTAIYSTAGTGTNLGFVSSIGGLVTVNVTDTTAVTNEVTVGTGETAGLVVNQPIVFSASIGGLVAGTVYYVLTIVDGENFTVGSQANGTDLPLLTATGTLTASQDSMTLAANAAASVTDSAWTFADDEAGFIVRQKGRSKFLVTGVTTGLTGVCYTANVANTALTPNTMSIVATLASAATVYIDRLSDHNAEGFGNVTTATPYYASFNAAAAADATPGQPYPVVTIASA